MEEVHNRLAISARRRRRRSNINGELRRVLIIYIDKDYLQTSYFILSTIFKTAIQILRNQIEITGRHTARILSPLINTYAHLRAAHTPRTQLSTPAVSYTEYTPHT